MSCSIKNRLITSIKQDIKQNATSYQFEDAKVFIPFNPNSKYVKTLDQAVQLATEKVLKINNKYKYWSKGDITSLDTTPRDGVYINIHPTKDLLDAYEHEEAIKDAEASEKESKQTDILFQNQSTEGQIASEKTIRDLAARMSDRIGIPIKFQSDRILNYKGKIENGVSYINLAHATLDTVPHEILAHPIIRALKIKSEQSIDVYLQEMIDKGIITKEC